MQFVHGHLRFVCACAHLYWVNAVCTRTLEFCMCTCTFVLCKCSLYTNTWVLYVYVHMCTVSECSLYVSMYAGSWGQLVGICANINVCKCKQCVVYVNICTVCIWFASVCVCRHLGCEVCVCFFIIVMCVHAVCMCIQLRTPGGGWLV
jgi:hypothetical protein